MSQANSHIGRSTRRSVASALPELLFWVEMQSSSIGPRPADQIEYQWRSGRYSQVKAMYLK